MGHSAVFGYCGASCVVIKRDFSADKNAENTFYGSNKGYFAKK